LPGLKKLKHLPTRTSSIEDPEIEP